MIQEMTLENLKWIYYEHMVDDFPENERKPYHVIQSRYKKKENLCICYYEHEVMKGYSILEFCEENHCLLMDYFAVFPEYRGKGTGTRFLSELKEYFKKWDALLIESETAVNDTAEKRLKFYEKSGAVISGASVHLYHVDYEILVISLKRNIHLYEVQGLMDKIYQKIYKGPFHRMFLRWNT